MGSEEFLAALLLGLGIGLDELPRSAVAARRILGSALAERSADGPGVVLILDEAHLAPAEMLEEVRLLSNGLGRPDGFAAILVLGQTGLATRIESRALAPLGSRIAARLHLRPLDADEARDLLATARPGRDWSRAEADSLQMASRGNARGLLLRADSASGPVRGPVSALPASTPTPTPVEDLEDRRPAMVPTKPPLRVEDGLIEVGWDSGAEDEPAPPPPRTRQVEAPALAIADEPGPEPIEDHYAALQAWEEWARNQGRIPEAIAPASEPDWADPDEEAPEADADPTREVWSEGEHRFAPYGQLFARLRESKDSQQGA